MRSIIRRGIYTTTGSPGNRSERPDMQRRWIVLSLQEFIIALHTPLLEGNYFRQSNAWKSTPHKHARQGTRGRWNGHYDRYKQTDAYSFGLELARELS